MIRNIVDRIANRVRWGYLTAFLLLLISYILTFYITKNLLNESEQMDHNNKVINNLNLLQSAITHAESLQRGYILMKDESMLQQFNSSKSESDSIFNLVKFLTEKSYAKLHELDSLKQLVDGKFRIMNDGLTLFGNDHFQASDSLNKILYLGNQVMEKIRAMTAKLQMDEKEQMSIRNDHLKSTSTLLKVVNIISLIVAILLVFYSIVTFNKENHAKQKADMSARAFRNQLEMRITELHNLNNELVELKSIEKFAATGRIARTIAHEVRNPLTNINLAAEHLKSEITPDSETDLLIEMITRNANRINQLISDLLNSTRASPLEFVEHNVNELLEESLHHAHDRIELNGVKVIKDYASDVCPVLVDAEKIKIAFLNVIVNAIEAMQLNKGVLKIKTEKMDERCIVTISDNGKGMSQEELTNLFEPYFTTKENGNGLGLTNTQNIILSHNANIVANTLQGKGTTFTITFK